MKRILMMFNSGTRLCGLINTLQMSLKTLKTNPATTDAGKSRGGGGGLTSNG